MGEFVKKKVAKKTKSTAKVKPKTKLKAQSKVAPKAKTKDKAKVKAGVKTKVSKKIKSVAKPKMKDAKAKPSQSPRKLSLKKTSKRKKVFEPRSVRTPFTGKRQKVFPQISTERPGGFPALTPELPENYGLNRLVLMAKNPSTLYLYWELTPQLLADKAQQKNQYEDYQEAIRLHWPVRSLFDMNAAILPVSFNLRHVYLPTVNFASEYHVEIGWLGSSGNFISLLESNPVAKIGNAVGNKVEKNLGMSSAQYSKKPKILPEVGITK